MAQLPSKPQEFVALPRRPVEDHYHNSPDRRERPRESAHYSHDSRSPSPRTYRPREENYASSSRDAGRGRYHDSHNREQSDWRTRGKDDTYRPSPKSTWRDRDERYDRVRDRRDYRDERYGSASWDRDRGPRSPRGAEYLRSSSGKRYRDERSPAREDTPDRRLRSPRRQSGSPSLRARRSPPPSRKSRSPSPRRRDILRRSPRKDSPSTSAKSDIDRDLERRRDIVRTLDHDGRPNSPLRPGERADLQLTQKERSVSPFVRLSRARSISPQSTNTRSHSPGTKFADPELDSKPASQPGYVGSFHDEVQKDDREGHFTHHTKESSSIPATPGRENFQSETNLSGPQRRLPNVNTNAHVPRGPRSGIETRTPASALPQKEPTKEDIEESRRLEERRKKEAELARLRRAQVNMMAELAKDQLAMRRAKHESFLATLDRKVAERRRQIAEIQFEQAQDGKLGIDYDDGQASELTAA